MASRVYWANPQPSHAADAPEITQQCTVRLTLENLMINSELFYSRDHKKLAHTVEHKRSGVLVITIDDFRNPSYAITMGFKTDGKTLFNSSKFQDQLLYVGELPRDAALGLNVQLIETDDTRFYDQLSRVFGVAGSLASLAPPPYGPAVSTGFNLGAAVSELAKSLVDDDVELAFAGSVNFSPADSRSTSSTYTLRRAPEAVKATFKLERTSITGSPPTHPYRIKCSVKTQKIARHKSHRLVFDFGVGAGTAGKHTTFLCSFKK